MKKLVSLLLLLLSLTLAGLPYLNGWLMENAVREMITTLNADPNFQASQFKLELTQYQRGYGNSQFQLRLDPGYLATTHGVPEIILEEKAKHGIFGITGEILLDRNAWFTDLTEEIGHRPLTITNRFPLLGDISIRFDLAAVAIPDSQSPMEVQPAHLTLTMNKTLTQVKTEGEWGGISDTQGRHVKGLRISGSQKRITDMIWDGEVTLSLDSIDIPDADEQIKLTNLSLTAEEHVNDAGDRMDFGIRCHLDEFIQYGTLQAAGDVEFHFKGLSIPALEGLGKAYQDILTQAVNDALQNQLSPTATQQLIDRRIALAQTQLMTNLNQLLVKDLTLDFPKVDLTLAQGTLEGDLTLGLTQDTNLEEFYMLAMQPDEFLKRLAFESNFKASAGLIEPQPFLISPVMPGMSTGVFVQDNENYQHHAQIKDGVLSLNGSPVNLN